MKKVKRTERGWAGHFICADRCRFRRNTLLEFQKKKIVVSTVGLMEKLHGEGFDTIGSYQYYETKAFYADPKNNRYHDIDVSREIHFDSEGTINKLDADDKANDMHEKVVGEITAGLLLNNY